jgi:hypothetical protein
MSQYTKNGFVLSDEGESTGAALDDGTHGGDDVPLWRTAKQFQ